MCSATAPMADAHPRVPRACQLGGWPVSVGLGALVFAVYMVNGRELGTDDTAPTSALAVCLDRGDGLFIERFLRCWKIRSDRELPAYLARWRGHVVSRYPVAPALLAFPIVAFQAGYLDRAVPGWDRHPDLLQSYGLGMTKLAAALIAALTVVVLHRVLIAMGLSRVAIAAALAAGLGSELWAVASQALWQHGPAALALITCVWLLLPRDPAPWRLMLAGLAATALVAFRLFDVVFALAIARRVTVAQPRRLAWFLPAPMLGAVALVSFNLGIHGSLTGGQAYLESLHPTVHGLPAGAWSGDIRTGAAGTLFSPSRGLLVFTPWVALALATLPASARRLAPWHIVRWLLWAMIPYGLLLAKYTVWWGGHCFGPRYWTDVTPLLAILLASGLDWSYARCRALAPAFMLAIGVSIGIQAIGAFCYPSDWNATPTNVDLHHERLWNWRDSELTRCLIKGPALPLGDPCPRPHRPRSSLHHRHRH